MLRRELLRSGSAELYDERDILTVGVQQVVAHLERKPEIERERAELAERFFVGSGGDPPADSGGDEQRRRLASLDIHNIVN